MNTHRIVNDLISLMSHFITIISILVASHSAGACRLPGETLRSIRMNVMSAMNHG